LDSDEENEFVEGYRPNNVTVVLDEEYYTGVPSNAVPRGEG
jgi:hypothetical protein